MSINLNVIPVNWLVPGAYLGVDNSNAIAGLPAQRKPIILLGMRRSTGTVAAGVRKPITGPKQGATYFGRGSQLAHMCEAFVKANPYNEVYALALDEDAAGVKATSTVTVTGPATADGTLVFVWGGRRRVVGVTKGQTAAQIATAIKAADDADGDSATTSAVVGAVVTASARHKGAYGNDLAIVLNYYTGDATPAGVTVEITDFTGGTTDPDITDAIAAMGGDTLYYTIVPGWNGDANMDALEAELETRANAIKAIPGHAIGAFRGDHTASVNYGNARNSQFNTVMATGLSPTAPWIWASVLASIEAAESDPATPRQNTKLPGLLPPVDDGFKIEERQLLLVDGMATYKVVIGEVYMERLVTTYQVNANNIEDASYKDIEVMRCLAYFRAAIVDRFLRKYPKAKLGNDGEKFAAGQIVVTPKLARGEILAVFDLLNYAAIVEDRKQFAAELIVERDVNNVNALLAYLPPNFVNQFRQFVGLVAFKL